MIVPAASKVVTATGAGYKGVRMDKQAKANVAEWTGGEDHAERQAVVLDYASRATTAAEQLHGIDSLDDARRQAGRAEGLRRDWRRGEEAGGRRGARLKAAAAPRRRRRRRSLMKRGGPRRSASELLSRGACADHDRTGRLLLGRPGVLSAPVASNQNWRSSPERKERKILVVVPGRSAASVRFSGSAADLSRAICSPSSFGSPERGEIRQQGGGESDRTVRVHDPSSRGDLRRWNGIAAQAGRHSRQGFEDGVTAGRCRVEHARPQVHADRIEAADGGRL